MMGIGSGVVVGLLSLIAAVNVAQFGHQLVISRKFARHRTLPADEAHSNYE